MRLLLDECVPKRLARDFAGHQVATVTESGWSGLSNGDLLRAAAGEYDALITIDQGIEFQQNIARSPIPIILLVAPSNEIDALRPLVAKALAVLPGARAGQFVRVSAS